MTKQLYTYEKEMPTVSIYREHALREMPKMGCEIRFKHIMEVTKEDLAWCDVFESIRPNDPYTVHLARCAKQAGRFVIAYYDDELYDLPESLPNPFWRKNSVRNMLRTSDMVHSSSRHICHRYKDFTLEKRGVATDTAVDPAEIKMIAQKTAAEGSGDKVKLIYAANPGHVGFFNRFILPIMPKLCQRYAGKISMTFMGVCPQLSEFESEIEIQYIPSMPLAEYRQKIQDGCYDIGLSPLTTDMFTKCKYFNKFIEYTMAGIVGVYSNTEPYTYVVEDGKNGFLADDAPEDWYAVLCRAIDDELLRNRCVCTAQKLLLSEFNSKRLHEKEKEDIPELYYYSAERKTFRSLMLNRLLYRLMRLMDKVYLLCFFLRKEGISSVLKRIRK